LFNFPAFFSLSPCTIENLKLAFHLDKLIGNFLVRSLGLLTVIVGKSGSGKSSFVGALLKEVQIKAGRIEWNK
jgi:ABC-type transport system involved in cytochrome bd biosynthesis fused ATPase/permease subunit